MAVNKISLNSVEAQNVSQITILPSFPVDNVLDQFDIFYHLGSNLQQGAWSNPQPSNVIFTVASGDGIEAGSLAGLTFRSQVNAVEFAGTGNTVVQIEFLNNFEVDLQSYIIANDQAVTGPSGWLLEASNDAITWVQLDQINNAPITGNQEGLYYCESRLGFFKYFRFRNWTWSGGNQRLAEVMFFGRLRNLVTGQAAIENTKDIFASYPSVDAPVKEDNSIIRYDGTYWEPRIRFPFEVIKLTLTGDHTITSAYKPTFYVISPNGANRVVTLPTSPDTDDVIKIKNLDGAFDLTVEEFVGDPSPVVMNNAGKLQYEFVYDGTEWLVTG